MKIIQIFEKARRRLTFGISILFIACLALAMATGFFLTVFLGIKLPFPVIALAGSGLTWLIYKECARDSRPQ